MSPIRSRRRFLHHASGALALATLSNHAFAAENISRAETKSADTIEPSTTNPAPLAIGPDPQLFLDDELVGRMEGLDRQVQKPKRLEAPILDSAAFGTTQPYLTVLRDPETSKFRLWYNHGPTIWHVESDDGIAWKNPRVAWDLPRGYGSSLVDDAQRGIGGARRFKLANWQATRAKEDKPGDDGGMYVGFSPDGFEWRAFDGNPVLPTWPEGYGKFVRHGIGDIVDVYFDPLAKLYRAVVKVSALAEDGYAPAPRAGKTFRRLVGISASQDFMHWDRPHRILVPDHKDEGLLEFYGMGGMHLRGRLHIGLARILRDDLPCDPGGPKDGIGYSVLVTSRDGVTWNRYREPFLDRDHVPGRWDHAMAWISGTLHVGAEVYFYYGGYARGHKVEPTRERQVGLAKLPRDRYVALRPTGAQGRLQTRPFVCPGGMLTLNADAGKGMIVVGVRDEAGRPIADFPDADAAPFKSDSLRGDVVWSKPIDSLRGRPIRLTFDIRGASLFAFQFAQV